ncbi:hypothetical protein D6789_03585 [Candidatus Woesearchaeota archaeon]|nr:MAG: hypothetical protein D6789_03585 [Candidatus Woesearchaeota archaeon]
MNTFLIFFWVWMAMVANSFWEAYVEGKDAWNKGKVGWELRVGKYSLTAYQFFLWWVMWPLLLLLPLVAYGWDTRLFGILLSAYASGIVLEDFLWFVVNPVVPFKNWNPHWAYYYPWLVAGRFRVPLLYIVGILVAILSWALFWH